MSHILVIKHIQKILNECGDPVVLTSLGKPVHSEFSGHIAVEIRKVLISKQNKCCTIPPPTPCCKDNPDDKYWVNRIRISTSLASDYSKGDPLTDDEMRTSICKKEYLFGCYQD